jgi:hypothetical protein
VVSAWCTSSAVSSRSRRAPIVARIGARTFSFFLTVLADRPPRPSFSQSSAAPPEGVVRARPHACFEVAVERFEAAIQGQMLGRSFEH